jgi:predicted outer membrane repeat protein
MSLMNKKICIFKEKTMKRIKRYVLLAGILLGAIMVTNLEAQTTIRRSYYVNAKTGDDSNNGRSEDAPFKTMAKALESAKMGVVKTITIIGEVAGFAGIDVGTDEILITGKPDAVEADKAKITDYFGLAGENSAYKFTYITIENQRDSGISASRKQKITLGKDVIIQNCSGGGIWHSGNAGGQVIITDNAIITGCKEAGVSSFVPVIMTDNASVTNNTVGISSFYRGSSYFTLTMSGNAKISGNQNGGVRGIDNGSPKGTVTISENAEISNNATVSTGRDIRDFQMSGGGVFVDNLVMNGGRIINNTAKKYGGGIYISGELKITGGEISGNHAERGGGVYSGRINMSGGIISANKAEYGAGFFVEARRSFNMSGGSITDNEAEFVGGGVYVEKDAKYTTSGGSVTGNVAGDGDGNDVFNQ